MKVCTPTLVRCRYRNRTDAKCKRLRRCLRCRRVLGFDFGDHLCFECSQQAKAKAYAEADTSTRRCQHCNEILQGVFADRTCTACAGIHNVKEAV